MPSCMQAHACVRYKAKDQTFHSSDELQYANKYAVSSHHSCKHLQVPGTHIVEHDADKHVERDPEEVDDCGPALLRHILASHFHHAGPKETHTGLKHTKSQQLNFTLKSDACISNTDATCQSLKDHTHIPFCGNQKHRCATQRGWSGQMACRLRLALRTGQPNRTSIMAILAAFLQGSSMPSPGGGPITWGSGVQGAGLGGALQVVGHRHQQGHRRHPKHGLHVPLRLVPAAQQPATLPWAA